MGRVLGIAMVCLIAPLNAATVVPDSPKSSAIASRCDGPIGPVIEAALKGIARGEDYAEARQTASRWSSIVPRITVNLNQLNGLTESIDGQRGRTNLDVNNRQSLGWYIRASWNLNHLVFDPATEVVQRTAQRLRAERMKRAAQVIDIYIARLKTAESADADHFYKHLRLTAQLNALTGNLCGDPSETERGVSANHSSHQP